MNPPHKPRFPEARLRPSGSLPGQSLVDEN